MPQRRAVTPTDAARAGTRAGGYGLAVGTLAPDASVRDSAGAATTLSKTFSGRPVLLVFYRGGWCPYCNFQLHELSTKGDELRRRGVTVVAISVDKPQFGAKTAQEISAGFVVLSDSGLDAHRSFRVVTHVGGATAFALARMGADLEDRSGQDHHDVAVPSLFLIDRRGVIRWVHTDPEYKRRPSADTVLAAIDRAGVAEPPAPASGGAAGSPGTAPAESAPPAETLR